MKKKRFSVEQIAAVLEQAELGMPVADITRQVGISEQTSDRWRKPYAGMESDQVRERKQLLDANLRLKKLVAEPSLDEAILQDSAAKKRPPRALAFGGGVRVRPLRFESAAGLPVGPMASKRVLRAQCEGSEDRAAGSHARDRSDARALRPPENPRDAAKGGWALGRIWHIG